MDIKKNLPVILTAVNTVLLIATITILSIDKFGSTTSQRPKAPAPPQRPPLAKNVDMNKLLTGAKVHGSSSAKATIVVFNSFSCGYCAKARVVLNQVVQKYGKEVRIAFKHYNRGEGDVKAAMALECAGAQGRHWQMYNTIFEKGMTADFSAYAPLTGLNQQQFKQCMANPQTRTTTMQQTAEGRSLGITGTPAFVINGDVMVGFRPFEAFEAVLKKYL